MNRLLLLTALLWSGAAQAQVGLTTLGAGGPVGAAPPPAFTGIADCTGCLTSPTVAYSVRAISAATAAATAQAVNLRRTSDSHTCDIKVTTAGNLDTVTSGCSTGGDNGTNRVTWCTASAGTCTGAKWYDQTGGGRNVVQATTAAQPAWVENCNGSLPCFQASGTSAINFQSSANFTPATGVVALSAVANRAVGTCGQAFISENGSGQNSMGGRNGTANRWIMLGTAVGATNAVASDAAWHAGNGNVNTTSSVLNVDGTDTNTSITTNGTAAGKISVLTSGAASCTVDVEEVAFWDNTTMSSGNRTSAHTNQSAYWGTP